MLLEVMLEAILETVLEFRCSVERPMPVKD
ncbi:hypothetical protein MSS2_04716 [Mycobacterium marinum]|nr:hypothetical protein MSS2_04716 [Mycobacterium marinum]